MSHRSLSSSCSPTFLLVRTATNTAIPKEKRNDRKSRQTFNDVPYPLLRFVRHIAKVLRNCFEFFYDFYEMLCRDTKQNPKDHNCRGTAEIKNGLREH